MPKYPFFFIEKTKMHRRKTYNSGFGKTRFMRPSDEQMINVFDKEFSNEKVSKFSLNSKVKTLILTGIRYATPECGSCQRSKLSDEECLVMTRGKIVSISQEEVNLFPTFKLNTIEQFSMLCLELHIYIKVSKSQNKFLR